MKKYLKLAGLVCLLSTNIWAGSEYVVLHNHTNKRAILSYQAGKETKRLVAGPGMTVSNIDTEQEYRMIALTLNDVEISQCDDMAFGKSYLGANIMLSGFKQTTCRAVVHDRS